MIIATIVATALLSVAAYDAVVIASALATGRGLADQSEAFSRELPACRARILVAGDSTAVGTGVDNPRRSVAGRLAEDFPQICIDNVARNGARTRAVPGQLEETTETDYALVLLQTGGNDVLAFTSRRRLRENLASALQVAGKKSRSVVLMGIGDFASTPAIPWPLSLLYAQRSSTVRDVLKDAAQAHGATFVDLFVAQGQDDPFARDPQRYYAADGLHPSAEGYAQWYSRLSKTVPLKTLLEPESESP